jgi:hypothetical protein
MTPLEKIQLPRVARRYWEDSPTFSGLIPPANQQHIELHIDAPRTGTAKTFHVTAHSVVVV